MDLFFQHLPRTIIAELQELQELQECGDEWSLINFDKKFNKL